MLPFNSPQDHLKKNKLGGIIFHHKSKDFSQVRGEVLSGVLQEFCDNKSHHNGPVASFGATVDGAGPGRRGKCSVQLILS